MQGHIGQVFLPPMNADQLIQCHLNPCKVGYMYLNFQMNHHLIFEEQGMESREVFEGKIFYLFCHFLNCYITTSMLVCKFLGIHTLVEKFPGKCYHTW